MKHLLFCIYSHNTWGGIERWLTCLAHYLPQHGWQVTVALARGTQHNLPERFRAAYPDLKTVEIDGRVAYPEGRIRAVETLLERINPDVVLPVGLGEVLPAMARWKARGGKGRLALVLQATNYNLLTDIIHYSPIVDLCVGVNPLHERFLAEKSAIPAQRLRSILNGVPVPAASWTRPESKTGEPLRIAFVGRLTQGHKRILDAIPLIEELQHRKVSFRFSFIGAGECEPELRTRLAAAAESGQVRFHGYLAPPEVQRQLQEFQDVLVLFSPMLGEGCPLSIQEAMGCGVVPVVTDFIGVHSLGFLTHGETGCIYPVGQIQRAATYLEELGTQRNLLSQMSRNARRQGERFALDTINHCWLESLEWLLDQPARREAGFERVPGFAPVRGENRLDRLGLPPVVVWKVRQWLRRWPQHPDGWAEWPGTLSAMDREAEIAMLAELQRLDEANNKSVDALHVQS